MKSPENGSVINTSANTGIETELKGRAAIEIGPAWKAQEGLVWALTPQEILDLIPKDPQGNLYEGLFNRYLSKYDNETFNRFADYCNLHAVDYRDENGQTFIDRANQGMLTDDDFNSMKNFLEETGGKFFENDLEVKAFIEECEKQQNN